MGARLGQATGVTCEKPAEQSMDARSSAVDLSPVLTLHFAYCPFDPIAGSRDDPRVPLEFVESR